MMTVAAAAAAVVAIICICVWMVAKASEKVGKYNAERISLEEGQRRLQRVQEIISKAPLRGRDLINRMRDNIRW